MTNKTAIIKKKVLDKNFTICFKFPINYISGTYVTRLKSGES